MLSLRMYTTYSPDQKFDSIRISVLRDITKIWKKITHIKDVRNILYNNCDEKLLVNR